MKWTFSRQIALLLFLEACGVLITFGIVYRFLSHTAADGAFLNVAGRQRMLSEQLGAYAHMVHAMGHEEDRDPLQAIVESFDQAHQALMQGGRVMDYTLPPPPPEVEESFAAVGELWQRLQPTLLTVARRAADDPEAAAAAADRVQAGIPLLTAASHQVVVDFQARGEELEQRMVLLLVGIAGFDFVVLLLGVWTIRRYVVERQRMEAQLRQAQTAEAIAQLTTGIVHEINNPLTLVIGYAKLLLKGELGPDLRQRIEAIHEGGTRAEAIVKQLLTFSQRQKSGKQVLDLNAIVRQSLKLVRYSLEADHVQLTEELEEALPPVEAHPGQLQQVILDLVYNGRDAILGAGRKGTITVRSRSREDRVVLEVEDDGPGIPEGIRERIFEPFFTTRDVGQGTGLGLSVCHGIARDHGGKLWVEGRGAGACLVLELPLATRQQRPASTDPQTHAESVSKRDKREIRIDET